MELNDKRNLSMLTDFYQLTMGNGYLKNGFKDTEVIFEMFFRKVPDSGGFAIACGLQQVIEYLKNLSFTKDDIEFLKTKGIFSEEFLDYLLNFKLELDIYSIKEGTAIFPNEPILKAQGPIIQAQLIETMVLLTLNHQSLIATKAHRIKMAAKGRSVMEFGSRRAQGYDAAMYGARASYIGGVDSSANTLADKLFGVKCVGTMAHSWIQLFDSEYEAFKAYAEVYPDNTLLLVDTYNTLKLGVPNAIKLAKNYLEPMGERLKGIRIDSGDLTYLSIQARKMLDEAGCNDCKIIVSNSLDEYTIRSLCNQGAQIDSFGVGERLVTAKSEPVFGGVYKLTAVKKDGVMVPRIKISDNIEKITNPGDKEIYRFYDLDNNMALGDVLTLNGESIDVSQPYELFDEFSIWKRKVLTNYRVEKLLIPIFIKGECVYKSPSVTEIKEFCALQLDTIWEETKRFDNPQTYYVDLSQKLWDVKQKLLRKGY
jgi:nicotinate phosphoribosyltransferase